MLPSSLTMIYPRSKPELNSPLAVPTSSAPMSSPSSFHQIRISGLLLALACLGAPLPGHGAPGDVDTAFDPQVNSFPEAIVIQPDDSMILGDWFSKIGGVPRAGIGRIYADGRLDTRFDPSANGDVFTAAVLPDRRILIGGNFTQLGGTYYVRFARLSASGRPDSRYAMNFSGAPRTIRPLPDGKVLVAGAFNTVNGEDHVGIVRLDVDGSIDPTFNTPDISGRVTSIAIQPDGQYLIGGWFDSIGGRPQTRIARLNPDGSHDRSLRNTNMEGRVNMIFVQPDDRILIAGDFPSVGGVTRHNIALLRPNGSVDPRYAPVVDNFISTIAPQTDGRVIIGGRFTHVNGVTRVCNARLEADGSLDQSFVADGRRANDTTVSCALQEDGKILVGGNFSSINGYWTGSFARLQNDPATQELTVPSADRIQWLRGGSSPEVWHVWFEQSTNGGSSWTSLAVGTRIDGGWEATGLSLSGDGLVRARTMYNSGSGLGSTSLIETTESFSFPPPDATTLAAAAVTGMSAVLQGEANAKGTITEVHFEYGLTDAYGSTVEAAPASVTGDTTTPVTGTLEGLLPETAYHFRVTATNLNGTTHGEDMTFTTLSDNADLATLVLNDGSLVPDFDSLVTSYMSTVPFASTGVTLTPTTEHPGASVTVDGAPVASGAPSGLINLDVGNTTIETVVTAEDGTTIEFYTLTVTRLPQDFVFHSATDVPVSADGFSTGGHSANVVLHYPPAPGTILTMVDNTEPGFIQGTFSNLSQGQRLTLDYDGQQYDFVANYFGGTGNDLVLQWADTTLLAWGANKYGQLGDSSTIQRLTAIPVDSSGILAGRSVVAVAAGYLHSLALCADGTLAAWGYNAYGQLGNGSSEASLLPVAVDQSGVLAGKTVVAIAAGPFHNLALCSDGSIAAWGFNHHGQLGNGGTTSAHTPMLVEPVGALAGKQVVNVAAANCHSLALCADGTVAAWGFNDNGELGDGTTASSLQPVSVRTDGVLAGKQVVSLAAGQYHTLALCRDGTVVSWGYNKHGQLGDGTTDSAPEPVEVSGGALSGQTVVALSAGGSHSLALRADGTLSSWGENTHGQLGLDGIAESSTPMEVPIPDGVLSTPPSGIAVGRTHSLALDALGTLAAWGHNSTGQLGDHSTTSRSTPAAVGMGQAPGAAVLFTTAGSANAHNLAVVAFSSANRIARARSNEMTEPAPEASISVDTDHDGIPDLLEYAFGLDPLMHGDSQLPQGRLVGDRYILEFTEPAKVTGIRYGAEWSASMLPGTWTEVPDTGSGRHHHFEISPNKEPRLFMRIRVTSQ